ncbi:hypothetical protein GCM10028862_17220 [Luteimonas pelagia]
MSRVQVSAVAVVALVVVVALAALRYESTQASVASGGRGSGEEILRRLAAMEARLAALEAGRARMPGVATPHQGPPMGADALAQMRQAAHAQSKQTEVRVRRDLDRAFASAERGGARQSTASQDLKSQANQAPLLAETMPPLSHDVECRRQLCKARFVFDELGDAEEWASLYPVTSGRVLSGFKTFVDATDAGTYEVVMYGELRSN